MVDDVLFSEWLNEQLQRKHMTQADLAKASGLAPSTIYKLVNSKTKQPYPSSCKAIADAFGISRETVLQAARISLSEPEFPEQHDLNMIVAQLVDLGRQEILAFAKVKLEFQKKGSVNID
jgi:transcriptional regulator with XRE-family HTH domain